MGKLELLTENAIQIAVCLQPQFGCLSLLADKTPSLAICKFELGTEGTESLGWKIDSLV